jgi:hypothetical protein
VQPQRKERLDNLEKEDRENRLLNPIPEQQAKQGVHEAPRGLAEERARKNSPGGP